MTAGNGQEESLSEQCGVQATRDPRWQHVRDEHIRTHSFCIACGNTRDLEAHHIKPFSQYPLLELDPSNLVTLCTKSIRGGMNCHLIMGHNGYTHDINPSVVSNSIEMLRRINKEKYDEVCEKVGTLSYLAKEGCHCLCRHVAIEYGDKIINRGLFRVQESDDVNASIKRCRLLSLRLSDEKIELVNLIRKMSHSSRSSLEDLSFARCLIASNGLGFQTSLSNISAKSLDESDYKVAFKVLFDTPGTHGIEEDFI